MICCGKEDGTSGQMEDLRWLLYGNSTGTGSKLDAGDMRCNVVVVTDGLGSWLDTLREHIYQNVSEICSNSMDTIAGMMVCVENI